MLLVITGTDLEDKMSEMFDRQRPKKELFFSVGEGGYISAKNLTLVN